MDPSPESAREIVRRSGSNLAFALAVLPGAARRDMEVFYAFCRIVDDLVDEPGLADDERRSGLRRWRDLVEGRATDPQPGIEQEFSEMQRRRDLSTADLLAILDGMEMDLEPQLFATKEDLRHYCYHVAGAVGLVSAALFGATDPEARAYAVELGYALQWTNILRDVGQDAREGRVFLPTEDIGHFGLTAEDLLSGSPDPEKFGKLMRHETAVARSRYREATTVFGTLPKADQSALRAAEMMRRIYTGILDRMEQDGFRVYSKRYRLGKPAMLGEFLRAKFIG